MSSPDSERLYVTAPTEAPECKVVVTNDEAQANIILRGKEGKVALLWKGIGADPKLRIKTPSEDSKINMFVPDDKQSLMRAIKRAARFTHYISPSQSPSPSLFEVEFKEVNDDTEEPEGGNLLKDRVAEVAIEHGSSKRFLVIRNKAKVDILTNSRFDLKTRLKHGQDKELVKSSTRRKYPSTRNDPSLWRRFRIGPQSYPSFRIGYREVRPWICQRCLA
ncbi:hypothetical protein F5887DRAFT_131017 [Amanita rubescens]|nr:hypothetical protein F5887DRAFT_131017 [Amanita rubescens]